MEIIAVTILSWWLFPSVWSVSYAMFDLDQSSGPDRGVNLSEVANHPSVMFGETVTISGTVMRRIDERAMILGSETGFRSAEVLVIGEQPLGSLMSSSGNQAVETDRVVRVTGTVLPFGPESAAEAAGANGDARIAGDYRGKSMVVADTLELDPPSEIGPGDKEFFSGSDGYDVGLTVYDIARHSKDYLGDEVTVSGEVEEGLLTSRVFLLGDEQLLVISPEPRSELFVEATAYVVGEVRLFDPAAVEADFGIRLEQEQTEKHRGEPVVIARTVEMVA